MGGQAGGGKEDVCSREHCSHGDDDGVDNHDGRRRPRHIDDDNGDGQSRAGAMSGRVVVGQYFLGGGSFVGFGRQLLAGREGRVSVIYFEISSYLASARGTMSRHGRPRAQAW